MRLPKKVVSFVIAISATHAMATEPIPDVIFVDGEPSRLDKRLPVPIAIPTFKRAYRSCSADLRGFTVEWEIREDKLFLNAIQANPCGPRQRIPFSESKIANWFSGALVVPRGREIDRFGSHRLYERYVYLEIVGGKVTERHDGNARMVFEKEQVRREEMMRRPEPQEDGQ